MERHTKLVIWVEVALVAILTVGAGIYDSEPVHTEVAAVSHEAVETADHAAKSEHTEKAEPKEAAHVEKAAEEKKAAPEPEKAKAPEKAVAEAIDGFTAVIALDNPAYEKHSKGIVQFTHQKHFQTYKIGCGECHHDDSAEPLVDLKPGDPVESCIDCHSTPSKAPKGTKDISEKLEYHTEALHLNCIVCHKQFNKKNKTKAAPQACGKCHPKKKK